MLSPRLAEGFRFLRTADLKSVPAGRIEIAGPSVFALVQDYQTKTLDQGFWESHRRHIDIQYVVGGTERIGHAPIDTLRVTDPFDDAKDLIKYAGTGGDFVTVREGQFTVFFPHDGHMPGIQLAGAGPVAVRKVVVKVAI
jgi:YhcH/YjgK/YiaL family protein